MKSSFTLSSLLHGLYSQATGLSAQRQCPTKSLKSSNDDVALRRDGLSSPPMTRLQEDYRSYTLPFLKCDKSLVHLLQLLKLSLVELSRLGFQIPAAPSSHSACFGNQQSTFGDNLVPFPPAPKGQLLGLSLCVTHDGVPAKHSEVSSCRIPVVLFHESPSMHPLKAQHQRNTT